MTRRAILFSGSNQPLELIRFPSPKPSGSELLVRVRCCTLCRSDLHTHAGRRIEPMPTVLGHEIVGSIEAFGADAPRTDSAGTPVQVGDRVTWAVAVGCGTCFYCNDDLPQKCERPFKYGHGRTDRQQPLGGGLADCILLVPGTFWLRVPNEVPDEIAAPVNCATATAAAMLRAGGAIEGRTVLVLGSGVLGVTACAMARSAGAKLVIVGDPFPACRDRAIDFGATQAFSITELTDGVRNATSGRGADLVLELAGTADSVRTAYSLVRTGGTIVLAGTVAPVGTIEFDPEQFVRRMLTVRGVHNYHPRDLIAALGFLAGPGRKYPWTSLIVARHSLENTEQAFKEAHLSPGQRVAVFPGDPGDPT